MHYLSLLKSQCFRYVSLCFLMNIVLLVFLVGTSFSMTFRWVDGRGVADNDGAYLQMSGDIETGDYERFRVFVRNNLARWKENRNIELSSNGGNLIEALKISTLLRAMYPTIFTRDRCASACFFLYLSGSSRFGVANEVGIHRAYFDPAYFGGLKPNEAKKKQVELTKLVNAILDENGVSQTLKDKMQQTSSANIHWLSDEELSSLGKHPAWYEELLIARCDYKNVLKANDEFFSSKPGSPDSRAKEDVMRNFRIELSTCEDRLFNQEISALNALLLESEK